MITDAQYRELAAYAPGSRIRLSAYNVGMLANPNVTITDADGRTVTASVASTSTHYVEVSIPPSVSLGGAYLTLRSGTTKSFGTLFVDSQDNIPSVNGCTYQVSPSRTSVPATPSTVPILIVTQAGCPRSVNIADSFVTTSSAATGTGTISVFLAANTGAARTSTIEIAGTPLILSQDAAPTSSALRFVPLPPCRILETRSLYAGNTWIGAFGPPRIAGGVVRTIPVTASPHCSVPANAKAFVFNVTLDTLQDNTGPVDFVTIWPTGSSRPDFWTARTTTGGYIANSAIVRAGTNGSVDVYASHDVNLLLDVNGYFTDSANAGGLLYYPIGPCRAVDTRSPVYSSLPPPYGNQKIQRGETRAFLLPASPVTNCLMPAAAAYSMQLTLAPGDLTNGSPVSYITVWPSGQTQPIISNMNSTFGYALANSAIVPARSDGSISVFAADATNLIVDVNGYFAPDDGTGRGLYYYPVTQCRVMNTLDSSYTGAFGGPAMTSAADRAITLPGSAQCPGLPSSARAWALNATATPAGNPMPFLSLWPAGVGWPGVSQLNAFQGQTVSNSAIVPGSSAGGVQVKVNATTNLALEVSGYFGR